MERRILCILLAAIMVVSLLSAAVFATDLPAGATGWLVDDGDNHVWYKLEAVSPATDPATYTLTDGIAYPAN